MASSYVLVCQNEDCKARGSGELLDKLSQGLKDSDVEVKPYMCFGGCQAGPNINRESRQGRRPGRETDPRHR
ncbi:MAG: hypothetical protein DMG11_11860 [Acidobacteria bacterium]|nr:MAG: hypothetical protein DMG11_11860 [Acidobacteriota bacterium]